MLSFNDDSAKSTYNPEKHWDSTGYRFAAAVPYTPTAQIGAEKSEPPERILGWGRELKAGSWAWEINEMVKILNAGGKFLWKTYTN